MRMNIVVDGYMCNSGQDDHHDYHIYSEEREMEGDGNDRDRFTIE